MVTSVEILGLVGLFILRLAVPITITAMIVYGLRRLDARWQAEAEAEAHHALQIALPPPPTVRVATKPCWECNGCPEELRRNCPAYQLAALPCWLARLRVEGRLPAKCYGCKQFQPKATLRQQAM